MNERIKELYSEAAVYAFDQRFIPGVVRELQEVITERFAELIVRECMDIISNQTTLDTNEDFREGFFHGHKLAWTEIRKQFGVEE